MKIHRFIGDFDLSKMEIELKNPKEIEHINQIKNVLRLKKGDKIILGDGKGAEAEVILSLVSSDKVTGIININTRARTTLAQNRKINLYLAILKKENFELAVQKAVEVGVSTITPVITERTIKTGLNVPRLEKIILEACEQSGRTIVPTLSPITNLKDAISRNTDEEKVIFHPSASHSTLRVSDSMSSGPSVYNSKKISIFVGPEGGFTEKEIAFAKESGFQIASLGEYTLRGETAAIVATYRAVNGI